MKNHNLFIPEDVNFTKDSHIIGLFSLKANEGNTTTSISFAQNIANKQHKKILLVDGNFLNPTLHKIFGHQIKPGLTDILKNSPISITESIQATSLGFDVMPIGSRQIEWVHETELKKLQELTPVLLKKYDFLIFDMVPLNNMSFTVSIGTFFDAIVMVLACESTSWEKAQYAKKRVESSGGTISGAILNKRKYYIPKCIYNMI